MDWVTQLDQEIARCLPELRLAKEEPMSRHTSFRIGGPARRMAFPASEEQLISLLELTHRCDIKTLVIGNGTNLLAPDQGLDCLVIDTSAAMNRIEIGENCTLRAEAGVSLARLADIACKQGWTGLEFAHGIPGTLGGAVCMNAGAYDGEMAQVVTWVKVLFPGEEVRTLHKEELDFGYRHSVFAHHPEAVVLSAEVRLAQGCTEQIREKMQELLQRRKSKQPLELPSAGSTFKRPEGHFAGSLIEQCGLKGFRVGGAQVSEKHAGFVVNCANATAADVQSLIAQVQQRVLAETGVSLEPEVRILSGEMMV